MKGRFERDLIAGLEDAAAYLRGDKSRAREIVVRVPKKVDVAAIRGKTGLSQTEFAACFGVSRRTLQDWEQRRRAPEGPARVLLTVIDKKPDAVMEAIGVSAPSPRRRKERSAA